MKDSLEIMRTRLSITPCSSLMAGSTLTAWKTSGPCSSAGLAETYVSVEPFHLFRYLDEQMFRFNNRKELKDADRFNLAVSQIVGKHLPFVELTGKAGSASVN
jgi:hypothetical protein